MKHIFLIIMAAMASQACAQAVTTSDRTTTTACTKRDDAVTLMFWGDMMQHDAQIWAAHDSINDTYDYKPCFANVKEAIEKADVAVCNFECTLAGKPYKGYPCFSAPDEYFEAMVDCGFDIFLTANNHCIDKGKTGLEMTIEKMKKRGVLQEGTYTDNKDREDRYPLIIDVKGLKVAMLNYTYGTNGIKTTPPNVVNYTDTAVIKQDIATSKAKGADFIIANMHWGIEYEHTQRKEQITLAHWLIDNGVDHVIGGHPHVVQPAEIYKGKDGREHFIIYSLGNVLANTKQEGGDGGIVVSLRLPLDKSYTKPDVSYSIFHVARKAWADVSNYIIFPSGWEGELPEGEQEKYDAFMEATRKVMGNGTEIEESDLR